MRCLLDTHAFIWSLTNTGKLPPRAKEAIANIENELFVSSVSFWEIAIKVRGKRLAPIGHEPSTLIEASVSMGFIPIPLTPVEAATHGNLKESTHFDPFDRMLIWQAISRNLVLISGDSEFKRFTADGLKLLWK